MASSTLTYKLKAVTREFTGGMNRASDSAGDLTRDLRKLERGTLEQREANVKVARAQKQVNRLMDSGRRETLQYQAAQVRLERAQERATRAGRAQHAMLGRIGTASKVAIGAAGAAGLYGVATAFRTMVQEARESVQVGRATDAVLKSTGGSANVTRREIERLAQTISNKTAIDDETIQKQQNLLLTFKQVRNETGKTNDIFNRASKASVDLAAALKQGTPEYENMRSATLQLGKALSDPIRGITALRRAGINFTEQQKDQIKALVESGKTLDAQKMILKEVESQVGGTAAAYADPLGRLRVVFLNLAESIGVQLLPYIEQGADAVSKFVGQMIDGSGPGGRFVDRMRSLADTVKGLVTPMFDTAKAIGSFISKNPELAKAAASFAIIGGALSKWKQIGGFGGVIRFAFQRGNTPATPLFVMDVSGGGRGPGGVVPGWVPKAAGSAALLAGGVGTALALGVMGGGTLMSPGTNKYGIPQMAAVERVHQLVGKLVPGFKLVNDLIGIGTTALQTFGDTVAKVQGKLSQLPASKLGELRNQARELARQFPESASALNAFSQDVTRELRQRLGKTLDVTGKRWTDLRKDARASMRDIKEVVEANTRTIRRRLSLDTREGAQAFIRNMSNAITQIRTQMRRGVVGVAEGTAQIRAYLRAELKAFGVTRGLPQATVAPDSKVPSSPSADWTPPGAKPLGSSPARGDEGGGREMGPPADNRSKATSTKQSTRAGFMGVRGSAAKLASFLSKKGFSPTSGYRATSTTWHGQGLALDYGTSINDLSALAKVLWPMRKYFDELFIPTWVREHGGLYEYGKRFYNAKLQSTHQDHIHVAVPGLLKILADLKIPRVKMPSGLGAVTTLGQKALDRIRGAAIRWGREQGGRRVGATVFTDPPPGAGNLGKPGYHFAELGTATRSGKGTGRGYLARALGMPGELPFGFKLRISRGGRSIVADKQDRGYGQGTPYYAIDLWRGAATALGVSQTTFKGPVTIEPVSSTGKQRKTTRKTTTTPTTSPAKTYPYIGRKSTPLKDMGDFYETAWVRARGKVQKNSVISAALAWVARVKIDARDPDTVSMIAGEEEKWRARWSEVNAPGPAQPSTAFTNFYTDAYNAAVGGSGTDPGQVVAAAQKYYGQFPRETWPDWLQAAVPEPAAPDTTVPWNEGGDIPLTGEGFGMAGSLGWSDTAQRFPNVEAWLNAMWELAQLTESTADDEAVRAQAQQYWGARPWASQFAPDWLNAQSNTQQAIADTLKSIDDQLKEQAAYRDRVAGAQGAYKALATAIATVASAEIGGIVGLGSQTPTFSGGYARY